MKRNKYYILGLLLFCGCEMFVIGSKKAPVIEINQKSPIGTVFLFKAKLDSNKLPDATELFLKADGNRYLAIEKYELTDEVSRLKRLLGSKSITGYKADTLSELDCKVDISFDWTRKIEFMTRRMNEEWFITTFKE